MNAWSIFLRTLWSSLIHQPNDFPVNPSDWLRKVPRLTHWQRNRKAKCAAKNNGKSRLCHHREYLFRLLLFFVDFFGARAWLVACVRKAIDFSVLFGWLRNNSLDRREVVLFPTKSCYSAQGKHRAICLRNGYQRWHLPVLDSLPTRVIKFINFVGRPTLKAHFGLAQKELSVLNYWVGTNWVGHELDQSRFRIELKRFKLKMGSLAAVAITWTKPLNWLVSWIISLSIGSRKTIQLA